MKLKPFTIPEEVKILELKDGYGKFLFSPLERGFGVTIGNSLRRILLSTIQGAAITGVRIDGVAHEFSTIPGVLEDVPQIVLNLKKVKVTLSTDFESVIHLKVKKKGEVKASTIECDAKTKIVNPEQYICTLTEAKKEPLLIDLYVTTGRGYVPSENLKKADIPMGMILVDGLYSPVTRVLFDVENTRVGQRTDYEKLILEIWTDGRISSKDALSIASKILMEHLTMFVDIGEGVRVEIAEEVSVESENLKKMLETKVSELEISVRARHCLEDAGIETLKDLVQKTEQEMLGYPNFGRKSLEELITVLKESNLSFGMDLSGLEDETQDQD
jgi:DNA-directed RNA polymerase subunit alpha